METHDLESWDEFRPLIQKIRADYGSMRVDLPDGGSFNKEIGIRFRGQSNSEWELTTTLERETSDRLDVFDYWTIADYCVNEIESFTGYKWGIKSSPEVHEELAAQDSMRVILPSPEYLTYLRHHGFPSPLLDWTTSPYIAAYFAYWEKMCVERIAIYAFIECPEGGKSRQGGCAMITVKGPYITTHPRHFAQKTWYTVATEWEKGRHYFCSHHKVLERTKSFGHIQDVIIKITLPAMERKTVLRELDDYNINHFTLFQSEDSLVKALAIRQFTERVTRLDSLET